MDIVIYIVVAIVCLAVGFLISRVMIKNNANSAISVAEAKVADAKREAETIKKEAAIEAKDEALKIKQKAEDEVHKQSRDIQQREDRLQQREDSIDRRSDSLDKREHQISSLQGQVEKMHDDLQSKIEGADKKLLQVAAMSREEAREQVLSTVKEDCVAEAAGIIRDVEARTKAEADKRSREILSVAIQRMAADYTAERTVTSVSIPSDDIKGRIIGREGRNIRSFEQITGVNLIIDDTPETVTLSCFDPVRREIARITLENLIADGRIHPARIEEMFKKATAYVEQQVQEAGEQATFEVGIHDLHPELVRTLGRLKYRTSFGQNVLMHSLEVSSIAGAIASELGLDPIVAKRAGLLHDLGKAVDHEVEGSHAVIGADLCRRYGESPAIVHAVEAHHADVEPSTVLAFIIQAADAVSAARPGARHESYENYIKRLEKLEEICNSHKGVEKTYAMQAGREIRVMVEPEVVDDAHATVLAHDIAKQIEDEMQYPGQIHVVVVRESRSEALAK
ncbi:MAG: ribonuclease Y [Coriobacteriales bacterium]|mgnify:FL=1|nr:ribonuclease Y [Coriobacteriales bacterium]MDY5662010.1 ribonuclease Y [Coriobacteriales bacterium]